MLQSDGNRGIPVIGHTPRDHLIHHDAQRIDITLEANISVSGLLRRRIVHRSHDIGIDRVGGRCPGNPEIGHLDLSLFGDHDILRFDIPVNDVLFVRRLDAASHLDRNGDHLVIGQLTLFGNIGF